VSARAAAPEQESASVWETESVSVLEWVWAREPE
jgi:hypothetical protein